MSGMYEDPVFFEAYARMPRSAQGLSAAGEWHQFVQLFPPLAGKDVLDMGCGYGWHSRYAAEQGARSVLGFDLSERMIAEAKRRNAAPRVRYEVCAIEAFAYPAQAFDVAVSNLALHYVDDLSGVFKKVFGTLRPDGLFLMNIEHPTFTAGVREDWVYDPEGRPLYWPVDDYFRPGERVTRFLSHDVKKYHHTLTQILMGLIECGFALEAVVEAMPDPRMLDLSGMRDELRRPMMLLVRARKPAK